MDLQLIKGNDNATEDISESNVSALLLILYTSPAKSIAYAIQKMVWKWSDS